MGCREFRVCARKFICLLIRVCKGVMFGWQTSPLDILKFFIQRNTRLYLFISVFLGRYHRNVVGRPDKRCSRVFLWMKNFNIPKKKEPLKGVVSEGSTPRTPCLLDSLNPPVCTCFEGWNVWERYLLYAWDIRPELEFEHYRHFLNADMEMFGGLCSPWPCCLSWPAWSSLMIITWSNIDHALTTLDGTLWEHKIKADGLDCPSKWSFWWATRSVYYF